MKAQGSVMQVMVGVLVVSVLLLFLFIVRTNTTQENISTLGRTSQTFRSRLVLTNIDSMTIRTHSDRKMELGEALSYACSYTEGTGPDFIDNTRIEEILKQYLDNYFGEENYVLEIDNCPTSISINTGKFSSLEGERRIGTDYLLNLPVNGETATVILYL